MTHDQILAKALKIMETRLSYSAKSDPISCPVVMRDYVRTVFATLDQSREHMVFVLLDAQHKIINWRALFSGTIDSCFAYPREVCRYALLEERCTAVVMAHNHPSGSDIFSAADIQVTEKTRIALDAVGLRLLDHILIAGVETRSMAAEGKI